MGCLAVMHPDVEKQVNFADVFHDTSHGK